MPQHKLLGLGIYTGSLYHLTNNNPHDLIAWVYLAVAILILAKE